MDNHDIQQLKNQIPIIPHAIEPYRDSAYRITVANDTITFHNINNLFNKTESKLQTLQKNTSQSKGKLTKTLIKLNLCHYIREKRDHGWHKWHKPPSNFHHHLATWCYRYTKDYLHASEQAKEGVVYSPDLTMGLIKRTKLPQYVEDINGILCNINLTRENSRYNDLKQRATWDIAKVKEAKQLYQLPLAKMIQIKKKKNHAYLLVLLGKRLGIIIAPIHA